MTSFHTCRPSVELTFISRLIRKELFSWIHKEMDKDDLEREVRPSRLLLLLLFSISSFSDVKGWLTRLSRYRNDWDFLRLTDPSKRPSRRQESGRVFSLLLWILTFDLVYPSSSHFTQALSRSHYLPRLFLSLIVLVSRAQLMKERELSRGSTR